MNIVISNAILDAFQLKNQEYLVDAEYYESVSGVNEYRLYSYLTTFFDDIVILDIGTYRGRSAISLSYNETNTVLSYDIANHIANDNHPIYSKKNITFRVKDVFEDLTEELVQKTRIVMIDIDHYEETEKRIIARLKELGFKGIILLDDTTRHHDSKIKECMQRLWDGITDEKYDLTKYGHCTGTGLVVMDDDIFFKFK